MKLKFIGSSHEVTDSCTMLEACGRRILIDCGMEQGQSGKIVKQSVQVAMFTS